MDYEAVLVVGCDVKAESLKRKTVKATYKMVKQFDPSTGKEIAPKQVEVTPEQELIICPVCKEEFDTEDLSQEDDVLVHIAKHFKAVFSNFCGDDGEGAFEPKGVNCKDIASVSKAWQQGKYQELYKQMKKYGLKPGKPGIDSVLVVY